MAGKCKARGSTLGVPVSSRRRVDQRRDCGRIRSNDAGCSEIVRQAASANHESSGYVIRSRRMVRFATLTGTLRRSQTLDPRSIGDHIERPERRDLAVVGRSFTVPRRDHRLPGQQPLIPPILRNREPMVRGCRCGDRRKMLSTSSARSDGRLAREPRATPRWQGSRGRHEYRRRWAGVPPTCPQTPRCRSYA